MTQTELVPLFRKALETGEALPFDMALLHVGPATETPQVLKLALAYIGNVDPDFQLVYMGEAWMPYRDYLVEGQAKFQARYDILNLFDNIHFLRGTPTPEQVLAELHPEQAE